MRARDDINGTEGFIPCTYKSFMFSDERLVRFEALAGPNPDGGAPHFRPGEDLGELVSPTDHLYRREGDTATPVEREDLVGEGLLRVEYVGHGDTGMLRVRDGFTGYQYDGFIIPARNFIPKKKIKIKQDPPRVV